MRHLDGSGSGSACWRGRAQRFRHGRGAPTRSGPEGRERYARLVVMTSHEAWQHAGIGRLDVSTDRRVLTPVGGEERALCAPKEGYMLQVSHAREDIYAPPCTL